LLEVDLFPLIDNHMRNQALATLTLRNTNHPEDSDVMEIDSRGMITKFIGKGQKEKTLGNAGVFVFNKHFFDHLPVGYSKLEADILSKMIGREKIFGYVSDEYMMDIGTPERYEQTNKSAESDL
jgi:mannose-1-phosphate guanylyltransferase/phosphomannomutase